MPERDITFSRACLLVAQNRLHTRPEPVALAHARGRRLTEDVCVLADHPPFTDSSMDGWAVRAADTPGPIRVVGDVAAGTPWRGTLGAGEGVRIATGGAIPDGADAVVPVEVAAETDGVLMVREPVAAGAFVRRRGDDVRTGALLLASGTRLGPHHLAAAAGAGHPFVACARRPRVAVLVSGDEVVPVGTEVGPGQLWDVNGASVPAMVEAAGGEVVMHTHVPDDRQATVAALRHALETADVVVTTGGVSMGAHDHLRPALAHLEVQEIFWGVGIRPGHPLWLGQSEAGVPVLALPGNPVSVVVCFTVFGRSLLGCGDTWSTLPLAVAHRSQTPRTDLIRCTLTADGLVPAARQSSHHITGLASGTHIAVIPSGGRDVPAGTPLEALALPM